MDQNSKFSNAPIGVFDSGYGGLTVLRELIDKMPDEHFIFVGDSARCPYGPRDLEEVKQFALQICSYLVSRECKMIVFACNTATAAGLKAAQIAFDIPIIGVVEPGARAAVHMTHSRRVGVIATQGTISSGAYADAIHNIDAGIKVFSVATPKFVEIVEQGVRLVGDEPRVQISKAEEIYKQKEYVAIANEYLQPLRNENIDTLVLGCTHFPLIAALIEDAIGEGVKLVSSAEESARDVFEILNRRGELNSLGNKGSLEIFTTAKDVEEFRRFGSLVLENMIADVSYIELP